MCGSIFFRGNEAKEAKEKKGAKVKKKNKILGSIVYMKMSQMKIPIKDVT